MFPCWVGHNYDSCARLSYSPWQSEFLCGFSGPSLFVLFDSVVAKAGFGGEQRQSRFDGLMAWWPAAILLARAGTGRRGRLSPHPAAVGARGSSTTKFITVFTIRFHAQAQPETEIHNQIHHSIDSGIHYALVDRIHTTPLQHPPQYSPPYSLQYSLRYSPRGNDHCYRGGHPC